MCIRFRLNNNAFLIEKTSRLALKCSLCRRHTRFWIHAAVKSFISIKIDSFSARLTSLSLIRLLLNSHCGLIFSRGLKFWHIAWIIFDRNACIEVFYILAVIKLGDEFCEERSVMSLSSFMKTDCLWLLINWNWVLLKILIYKYCTKYIYLFLKSLKNKMISYNLQEIYFFKDIVYLCIF